MNARQRRRVVRAIKTGRVFRDHDTGQWVRCIVRPFPGAYRQTFGRYTRYAKKAGVC